MTFEFDLKLLIGFIIPESKNMLKGGGRDIYHKNIQGYCSQLEGVSTGQAQNNFSIKKIQFSNKL